MLLKPATESGQVPAGEEAFQAAAEITEGSRPPPKPSKMLMILRPEASLACDEAAITPPPLRCGKSKPVRFNGDHSQNEILQ